MASAIAGLCSIWLTKNAFVIIDGSINIITEFLPLLQSRRRWSVEGWLYYWRKNKQEYDPFYLENCINTDRQRKAIRHCVTPGGFATAVESGGRRAETSLEICISNCWVRLCERATGDMFRVKQKWQTGRQTEGWTRSWHPFLSCNVKILWFTV